MARSHASTSNLGPGFDFLGLALGMPFELRARPWVGDGHRITHLGEAPALGDGERDLVLRCLDAFEERSGIALPPLELETRSEIPVGRGFGSSGASIAAALQLARGVAAKVVGGSLGISDETLRSWGLALDGHPDNVVAALLGGCTLSVPVEGDSGLRIVRLPVHDSIACAIAWPDAPLFTAEARSALPAMVPHEDAVENPRRLVLLLEGLATGDGELLRLGSVDRIHERYRRALIPGSEEAIGRALDAGAWCATLSGAGSGLVALGPRPRMAAVATALSAPLSGGRSRVVELARVAPPPVRIVPFRRPPQGPPLG